MLLPFAAITTDRRGSSAPCTAAPITACRSCAQPMGCRSAWSPGLTTGSRWRDCWPARVTPDRSDCLVLLHGGPVGGLVCGEHPDPSAWVSAGFTVFMPDFRASGIAGKHLMTEAFRRPWLPAADPEAGDVLAGVDMLIANGAADGHALFLLGHSYGGYLAGRILAPRSPVRGRSVLRCRRRPAASGSGKPEDASRLARQ